MLFFKYAWFDRHLVQIWIWVFIYAKQVELYSVNSVQLKKMGS